MQRRGDALGTLVKREEYPPVPRVVAQIEVAQTEVAKVRACDFSRNSLRVWADVEV